jgi:Flp pilus assembly protein TadG
METTMRRRIRNERGAALLEAAITIPLILLISVGIFEFGRAFQTWQVLTNAAREGARIAVISGTTDAQISKRVRDYLQAGGLDRFEAAHGVVVDVDRNAPLGNSNASRIAINYPFEFMVLNPVVRLVSPGSSTGAPLTMGASALMRNEN